MISKVSITQDLGFAVFTLKAAFEACLACVTSGIIKIEACVARVKSGIIKSDILGADEVNFPCWNTSSGPFYCVI
jgi:hypothetical protein